MLHCTWQIGTKLHEHLKVRIRIPKIIFQSREKGKDKKTYEEENVFRLRPSTFFILYLHRPKTNKLFTAYSGSQCYRQEWHKGSKQADQFVFKKQKSWRIGETWENITSFVSFIKSPKHMNPWLEAEKSLEY